MNKTITAYVVDIIGWQCTFFWCLIRTFPLLSQYSKISNQYTAVTMHFYFMFDSGRHSTTYELSIFTIISIFTKKWHSPFSSCGLHLFLLEILKFYSNSRKLMVLTLSIAELSTFWALMLWTFSYYGKCSWAGIFHVLAYVLHRYMFVWYFRRSLQS